MKKALLYVMSVLYLLAGVAHFTFPEQYLVIMPPWLPWHCALVYISGALEGLYGVMLMVPATQRLAALLIISLLIAVFPANVQMAVNYYKEGRPDLWIAIVRLPLQLVLIYWAYVYTKKNEC